MTCLQNRIGILGCDAPTAETDMLINHLPGIDSEMINALVDGDDNQTFLDLWKKIQLRTFSRFQLAVKKEINKCHQVTDNTIVSCLVCANKTLFDSALWYLHGTELCIEVTSTNLRNRYNTAELEKFEKLKADLYTEFSDFLTDAVTSMDLKAGNCITHLKDAVQTVSWEWGLP